MDVIVMYRPVNGAELALVQASGSKKWPPRLPEQPIFYPVINEKYACEIADLVLTHFTEISAFCEHKTVGNG
ncbi:MAG: hypothetical protein U1E94_00020 [Agitococcus sp.]